MSTAPSTTKAEAVDVRGESSPALVSALQMLYRAYQKLSIYPPGHPTVPRALDPAAKNFESALSDVDSILVGVARDHIWTDDGHLSEGTGALKSLALLLHDLDIAAMEFRRGLDVDELKTFVLALGDARRDCIKGAPLVEALQQHGLAHIEIMPIDYRVLNFADGARDTTDDEPHDIWENLATVLTDPQSIVGGSPEELAREVSAEIARQEGAGAGLLRKRIRRMSLKIDELAPQEQQAVRRRLGSFMAALNPGLRGDLLRVDPQRPTESVRTLDEFAELMPEPDLIDALQELDRIGARVPGQVLVLMNKLIRISHERPTLASGISDTLDKWGVPFVPIQGDSQELKGALEELFRQRETLNCNPAPYQELLEDLSKTELAEIGVPLEERYRDPGDLADLRVHAAEVAVLVLGKEGGESHRAGLFGYIETASETLIEHQRFEAIRDTAVSARTQTLLKDSPAEAQQAAKGYLSEFTGEERVQRILEHACRGETVPAAAISLLSLGGSTALDGALDMLSTGPPGEVARALVLFGAGRTPEELSEVIESRFESGWSRLKPLIPVLREAPQEHAIPLLSRLLAQPELRVRREALFALCDVDTSVGGAERHLRKALGSDDRRLVAAALRRLGKLSTPRSLELLSGYLVAGLSGVQRAHANGVVAANVLLQRGEDGLRVLCASLDKLRMGLRARTVKMSVVVADLLEPERLDSGVRSCLRRWRFSPAGLLRLFMPGRRRRKASVKAASEARH